MESDAIPLRLLKYTSRIVTQLAVARFSRTRVRLLVRVRVRVRVRVS